jgi:hypothetical protein
MKEYAIIVRTDSYAGNFERELCAHLTGIVGECEVGDEYVDESIESIFEGIVAHIPDDNGCRRPVSLGGCSKTKGFNGNDVVIWFDGLPSDEQKKLLKERALTFNKAATKHNQWHKKDIKIDSIILREIDTTINSINHTL